MGAGHAGYLSLLDEMKELHCRKAADYGRGADPFANVRAGADFGVPAWVGVMIRANDKMHRIKSFVQNGSLKNESVEDSLKDLAAYGLIALVLYREAQGAPEPARPRHSPGRKRVYIAGPISKGDLGDNIRQAETAFYALMKAGLAPFCPQWSCYGSGPVKSRQYPGKYLAYAGVSHGIGHDDWLGVDLPWVAVADAVLRLPGESAGADREVAEAVELCIPVFHDTETLIGWSKG